MSNLALDNGPENDDFDFDEDLEIDDVASTMTKTSLPGTLQAAEQIAPPTQNMDVTVNSSPPPSPVASWHSDKLDEENPPSVRNPVPVHQRDSDGDEMMTDNEHPP